MGIKIESIATAIPPQSIATEILLNDLGRFTSDAVVEMIQSMAIENRYSVVFDYSKYLIGERKREIIADVNMLAVESIHKCLDNDVNCQSICLFIAITNTAARPLPCTGYEILSMVSADLIPREVNIINMQNQGCSVLIKAMEIANDFLTCHPDKKVLITVSETHTALLEPINSKGLVLSFNEISNQVRDGTERALQLEKLHNLISSCLFGDGAVSLLLKNDQIEFKCRHLTNIKANDVDLLYMDEGGTNKPSYSGFPHYVLSKKVPVRGAFYSHMLTELMISENIVENGYKNIDGFLIHTGSKKIINAIVKDLEIEDQIDKAKTSYDVLSNFANLSSCSIGFMIDQVVNSQSTGKFLLISFGVGFSGSIATITI